MAERNSDPEFEQMKRKLLVLVPEMADQIEKMSKSDLKEVLDNMQANEEESGTNPKRQKMIASILETFPDMQEEIKSLEDHDIEEIYNQIQNQNAMNEEPPAPKENNKQVKKRKEIQNGEINVYEMKKTLIDRLPEFRTEIRNLPEEQIKKMFRELQAEDHKSQKKSDTSGRIFAEDEDVQEEHDSKYSSNQAIRDPFMKKRGRPKKYKDPFEDSKAPEPYNKTLIQKAYDFVEYRPQNYKNPTEPFQNEDYSNYDDTNLDNFHNPKKGPESLYENQISVIETNKNQSNNDKQAIKREKQKQKQHKCVITFYLDSSDFEEEGSQEVPEGQQRKRSGLAKVIEGISRSFKSAKKTLEMENSLNKAVNKNSSPEQN